MRRSAFLLLAVFLVALPDVVFIGIGGMPDLSPEEAAAFTANDFGGKKVCRTVMAVKRLSSTDFQLNAVMFERIDDRFVAMLNVPCTLFVNCTSMVCM